MSAKAKAVVSAWRALTVVYTEQNAITLERALDALIEPKGSDAEAIADAIDAYIRSGRPENRAALITAIVGMFEAGTFPKLDTVIVKEIRRLIEAWRDTSTGIDRDNYVRALQVFESASTCAANNAWLGAPPPPAALDEARRLFKTALFSHIPPSLANEIEVWLDANPEGKE